MTRVLVTGARGFVGKAVVAALDQGGYEVARGTREQAAGHLRIPSIGPDSDWSGVLGDVDLVVHLAARVHISNDRHSDPAAEFHRVNAAGTETLAKAAAACGARRLVFLSTVGVVGDASVIPIDEQTATSPANDYSRSKLGAETLLTDVGRDTGLEVVVLRAPLVYGRGAPGNLSRLKHAVANGVPIPLSLARNRRSAISVENLASAIVCSVEAACVADRILYVEDGTVWSSREMVERVAESIGRPPRLLPVPVPVLTRGLKVLGQRQLANRLLGSLVVDGSEFRALAAWQAPVSPDTALSRGVV